MANDMMNRRNDMMDAMNDWFGFPRNFFDDNEIENIMQSDVAETDKDYLVNRNIIHKERSEGSISRSYRLPNVVASEIHAKYDNGVLTITLPKETAGDDGNSIKID